MLDKVKNEVRLRLYIGQVAVPYIMKKQTE